MGVYEQNNIKHITFLFSIWTIEWNGTIANDNKLVPTDVIITGVYKMVPRLSREE